MTYDYYATLAAQKACPNRVNESGFASGFVDGCTVWSCQDKPQRQRAQDPKNEARQCYMARAAELENIQLPADLMVAPDFSRLPHSSWFGIEVSFTLETPWYSKDDRPFRVLDNPVRKDRVFGVPYMSAASWKGLLRWACRMQAGLPGHLETHGMKMDDWKEPDWIVHLFGNEKREGEHFRHGALVFYPTWFDKVGFEVINPHSRARRAGTQPIYYEVVPAGRPGILRLLYAPLCRETGCLWVSRVEAMGGLIDAIESLLGTYGISAKRTSGWGAVRIDKWTGFLKASSERTMAEPRFKKKTLQDLQELGSLVSEQTQAGSFTSGNAKGFKTHIKNRLAPEGGGR